MENSLFLQLGAWNWFILAAVLGVLELVMPGYFMIWYGLAALFVGALGFVVDLSWQYELILYAVIGIGLLLLSLRFAGAKAGDSDRPMLNRRAESHVGKTYALAGATRNGRGKVLVGDSLWSVRLEDGDLPAGANVVITGVDGTAFVAKGA